LGNKENDVNVDQGGRDQAHDVAVLQRPQPEYRVSLTLAVLDPQALWAAAAAKLLCAADMTLVDVLDVIGPREDPSITDCIAAMAKPTALAGCLLDDFWIDGLHGCPPRADIESTVLEYKLASADLRPRRAPAKRRSGSHITLSLIPPLIEDATTPLEPH